MSEEFGIDPEDLQLMEKHFAQTQRAVAKSAFDEMAATCYRTLPNVESLCENDRFVIGIPPVLIIHLQKNEHGKLRFVLLSSLLPELQCDGSSPFSIDCKAVFYGDAPKRLPPMRAIFWEHLIKFRQYSFEEKLKKSPTKVK
jgi:hypothetical protein